MVTILNYEKCQGTDGEFFLLQLQGEIEVVLSKATGMPYVTARKCKIPSTFDEAICKTLIGKEMPGAIVKAKVEEPYEYTIPQTKEKVILDYRYVYSPKEVNNSIEETVFEG
ncbi:hypothetical protein C8P68_1111 [Mucilaginibacter yixingensis]|uniref:Uncharacterized protein n=1 Tax=Mucilaginibacter yixingensis TaxID=1295612 RepID=A0A2T5J4N8_9SPHI|nr:hypothetical protein [Mucilaginibacter yixingensis]PTQ92625.1 hypothetical protein C8P68_1111 [Mucilaginibacter yixingensis]